MLKLSRGRVGHLHFTPPIVLFSFSRPPTSIRLASTPKLILPNPLFFFFIFFFFFFFLFFLFLLHHHHPLLLLLLLLVSYSSDPFSTRSLSLSLSLSRPLPFSSPDASSISPQSWFTHRRILFAFFFTIFHNDDSHLQFIFKFILHKFFNYALRTFQ